MKGNTLLWVYVLLLVLAGGGLFIWKVVVLRHPVRPGVTHDQWLLEAQVSFRASDETPVRVSLALPTHLRSQVLASEAASVGYGFVRDDGPPWRAVWTARNRRGEQRLYLRLRLPARAMVLQPFPADGAPRPRAPSLSGIEAEAARNLLQDAGPRSSGPESLLRLLTRRLLEARDDPEAQVLGAHFKSQAADRWLEAAVLELAAVAGVTARQAYGLYLEPEPVRQDPVRVIEVLDDKQWIVFDPRRPEESAPPGLVVWSRGGDALLLLDGGRNSEVTFSTTPARLSTGSLDLQGEQPVLISLFNALPLGERQVFRYIVLIPLGVLVVVVARNVAGIETLGTFMPVLLALAFLEIPIVQALILFGSVLTVSLLFRFQLSRLHLLVVPRVGACVVVVALLMLLLSVVGSRIGYSSSLRLTLFPIIILAWTVERMSLLWEEEGAGAALQQIVGSVVVASAAYLLIGHRVVQHLIFNFPELLLLVLAAILLLGRYTGYRLSELIRFRTASETDSGT